MEKYSKIVNYEDFQKDYIIDRGIYRGHEYVVRWCGSHPCAYVKPRCHLSDDQIYDIPVHGGITYCGWWPSFGDSEIFEGSKHFVGWDYMHRGDYITSEFEDYYNEKVITKKYTYEEIMKDIKKVINHLCILRASYKDLMLFDRLGGK